MRFWAVSGRQAHNSCVASGGILSPQSGQFVECCFITPPSLSDSVIAVFLTLSHSPLHMDMQLLKSKTGQIVYKEVAAEEAVKWVTCVCALRVSCLLRVLLRCNALLRSACAA